MSTMIPVIAGILILGLSAHKTIEPKTILKRPITANFAILAAVHSYCSDPELALAIIKNESNFIRLTRPDEDSTGLMQVRPGTARWLRCRAQTRKQLLQTSLNIECGCFLLGKNDTRYSALTDKISAYNAGSARRCTTGTLYPSGKKCKIGEYINQKYVDQVISTYRSYKGR